MTDLSASTWAPLQLDTAHRLLRLATADGRVALTVGCTLEAAG